MGEKRRWGNWDLAKRDEGREWPSKSPSRWGQQNQSGFNSWKSEESSTKHTWNGWAGNSSAMVPSWERKFCSYVCRVPWRKICDVERVMYIYKNVAEWDDSAGREAFENAKARYWAQINRLSCDISPPRPYMYIDKVDFDSIIDPELVNGLERCTVDPDSDGKTAFNHLTSSEPEPVSETGYRDAEQSSSNWDKQAEKQVAHSGWDDIGSKNGWGSQKQDQNDSWRTYESWKNCQDRRNTYEQHINNGQDRRNTYEQHLDNGQMNNNRRFSGENNRDKHSVEKKSQWPRGQSFESRNHGRTAYSGAPFQWENAVS